MHLGFQMRGITCSVMVVMLKGMYVSVFSHNVTFIGSFYQIIMYCIHINWAWWWMGPVLYSTVQDLSGRRHVRTNWVAM